MTPLTPTRISEIAALFETQRDADEILEAAMLAGVPDCEALIEASDAAANAINDGIQASDVLALCGMARRAVALEEALSKLLDETPDQIACGMRCQIEADQGDEDKYRSVRDAARAALNPGASS